MTKRKNKNKISVAERRAFILNAFREQPARNFTLNQLAAASGGNNGEGIRDTSMILGELLENRIVERSRRRFRLTRDNLPRHQARAVMASTGSMCLEIEGFKNTVFVHPRNMHTALDGDIVEAVVSNPRRKGQEGEIIRVIRRADKQYVGTTEIRSDNIMTVRTDPRKIPVDICLQRKRWPDLAENMRVLVRVASWDDERTLPEGELMEVLGEADSNEAEIHSIMAEFELPFRFSEEAERAAAEIAGGISGNEAASRRDMRGIPTFTIDPEEAKDFDDALSLRRTTEGHWEVGVHIADVSHYVQPDSLLDREARIRGTSVYLVDRTVPMLPERLSNELCSLRPDEDKLCFSALFTLDDAGRLIDEWFGRTVIRSQRRFTYSEAQQVIETGEGDMSAEILTLNRLAGILREERIRNGALLFERREARFELDADGHPSGISFKESKEANHLIEEFMLLANRRVAAFCAKTKSGRNRTMVYRIHDKPDPERLDKFRSFVARFGLRFRAETGKAVTREMNGIFHKVKGMPEENAVSLLAIRSMAKAAYSTDNIGHYGLGFRYYTHFTSPIRRYPDIMVHRLLAGYLEGARSAAQAPLEEECKHASERETVAAEAERASVKYKIAEYMRDRTDEVFEGHVSGLAEWGMFVELEDSIVEGAVHFRDFGDDDYYWFDDRTYEIRARLSGDTYTLGDRVRVRVKNADLRRRILDFSLVPDYPTDYDNRT